MIMTRLKARQANECAGKMIMSNHLKMDFSIPVVNPVPRGIGGY